MKRYFILAGVEQEGQDGRYAIADECFDIQASADGLWLHCPEINGTRHSINLTQPDKINLKLMMENLWREIRAA